MPIENRIIDFASSIKSDFLENQEAIQCLATGINRVLNPENKITRTPLMVFGKTSTLSEWRKQLINKLQQELGVNIGLFNKTNPSEENRPEADKPIVEWNDSQAFSLFWPTNMKDVYFQCKIEGLMKKPTLFLRRENPDLESKQV